MPDPKDDVADMIADWQTATLDASLSINGIFQELFIESNGINGSRPTFIALTADMAGSPRNTLTYDGTDYNIVEEEISPSMGTTMLILEE